jgi:hypothetical protein
MNTTKLFAVVIGLFFSLVFGNAYANNPSMTSPQPLNNKIFNSMIGTWQGQSDMMGTKMNDTLNIQWSLNHQFITMQLAAQGIQQPQNTYEGMGIFGIDSKGAPKTWWFDSWGASAAATGTGKFSGNKLILADSNAMFNEIRTFDINGDKMIMTAKGTMMMDGKKTPFDQQVVYTRKG